MARAAHGLFTVFFLEIIGKFNLLAEIGRVYKCKDSHTTPLFRCASPSAASFIRLGQVFTTSKIANTSRSLNPPSKGKST